jgi:heme-degrading monooxygenase HmoA
MRLRGCEGAPVEKSSARTLGRLGQVRVSEQREARVILRYWRGWTTAANSDAYEDIVTNQILPGIAARCIDGYRGAYLLRRKLADEVEFATIMLFDSLDAVRAFAGEHYETAYVPPAARAVLSEFDATSAHYEVLVAPPAAAGLGGTSGGGVDSE